MPARIVAVRGLLDQRVPIVVDDFHYIARDLQGDLVRALKPVIFDGVPVVIIAIPHRRYDAVKVEKEMTGRIAPIDIPNWSEAELRYIPETGFRLLNYDVHVAVAHRLGSQAIGSPHLMQEFCRGIGKIYSVGYAESRRPLNVTVADLEGVFTYVAETIGRPIFEKLAKGPNTRRDRIKRIMKSGRAVDIYELVLHALAEIGPGLTSIEYEELRAAMRDITEGQLPQINEISRVLKHMDQIAATDESSSPVIDYEDHDRKLHITDPFFAFYLRWGELARRDENGAA